MSGAPDERRAELIAAALAQDLSDDERRELEVMIAVDPSIAAELDDLGATASMLRAMDLDWQEPELPAGLRAGVLAATRAPSSTDITGAGAPAASPAHGGASVADLEDRRRVRDSTSRDAGKPRGAGHLRPARRRLNALLLAVGCFMAGALVTAGAYLIGSTPPSGPPGTLGAVEDVGFAGAPAGVRVDGSLVAHSWGTETVLEIAGLEVGASYVVVLVAQDGTEFDSGTFLGSEVPIDCRMNAAIMRHEVVRVEIRDDDGGLVTGADLPEAVES